METLILIGVLLGLAGGIAVTALFYKNRYSRTTEVQSVVLLEKIRHVCKLITVEGEFSEVFSHRDEKSMFFKLLQLEKKALLIVKAKVLVGFDLTKIHIETESDKRVVRLSHFPDPEVLSMETDLEYYDVRKGMMHKFSETDLTNMNKKSKEFIREKVERSYLFDIARNQAEDTISVIKQLIDSVGWTLETEKRAINDSKVKQLTESARENSNKNR